jgi:hypothetical protein
MYGVVLFASTSHAIKGEKVLQEAGVPVKLIPTPRQLSSDCGLALRFDLGQRARVEELMRERGVVFERVAQLAF